jgi:hypothetical protein
MNRAATPETFVNWTWADLVSTYRFWGLFLFYVLGSFSFSFYTTAFPVLRAMQNLDMPQLSAALTVRNYSGFAAMYLAWLTVRWQSKWLLIIGGAFQLAGAYLLAVSPSGSSAGMGLGGLLYWLYKVHGEIASVAPSRAILSPRGAVGIGLLPLMVPVIMTTVIDELNARRTGIGMRRLQPAWLVFLCSLLVFPVGAGLVQGAMNRFVKDVLAHGYTVADLSQPA